MTVLTQDLRTLDMQSDRLLIRTWEGRDDIGERLWPPYTDPFSPLWNIPRNRTLFDSLFSFSFSPHRYVWAVEDHTGTLIGRISLRDIKYSLQQARLGISLSQAYTSRGIGTEALTLFLNHFFGPLGFTVMLLDVAAFNYRAVRCYQRLGFQHIDTEWRKARPDPCLQLLDEPAYRHMLPFFQYHYSSICVQFLEMTLHKREWSSRP